MKHLNTPRDLGLAMDALLALGRMKEAASVARQCSILLNGKLESLEAAHLLCAMASYFEQSGEWESALRAWEMVPVGGPLSKNALVGKVEIHLARALTEAREGLSAIKSMDGHADPTAISLPGNEESIFKDAVKALEKLKRGIEIILPTARRSELGMNG
jgi:hypothetical protein